MAEAAFGPPVGPGVHWESHGTLLRTVSAGQERSPHAVIVSAARPAHHLSAAADLANRLGCLMVALCSGRARSDEFAAVTTEWPGLRWIAIDLPAGYHHPLLRFKTSSIDDVKVERLGDLSTKRNLGLLLARLAGWPSIMFLDDDIYGVDPATARQATASLDQWSMVGLTVDDYPDNSVVCHANRLAGGKQGVFISGSALFVGCERPYSFFPDVYNEDWLFFFDSLTGGAIASAGSARQLAYEPFMEPGRAVAEEFGDVLAEGLFSLLHRVDLDAPSRLLAAKEAAFWRQFLHRRGEFIECAVSRLGARPSVARRSAAVRALQAAEERRAAITAASCAAYVRTWRRDRSTWAARIAELDRSHTLVAALRRLGLSRCALFSHPPIAARRDQQMAAAAPEEPPAEAAGKVVIDPTAQVAVTAQIGAPYRRLLQGQWKRLGRPTTIAANCDIGHFCVVGEEVVIGEGSILDSFTVIAGGVTIGARVVFDHRASVGARAEIGDDCVIGGLIGERSMIGRGCRVFGDLVHRQLDPTTPWDAAESMEGSPFLDDGVFVGWGATVVGGIKIERGAYVCAGSTVTRDVPAGQIVIGINELVAPEDWQGPLGKSDFFRAEVTSTAATQP